MDATKRSELVQEKAKLEERMESIYRELKEEHVNQYGAYMHNFAPRPSEDDLNDKWYERCEGLIHRMQEIDHLLSEGADER